MFLHYAALRLAHQHSTCSLDELMAGANLLVERATKMNRGGCPKDFSFSNASYVVGINFQTNRLVLVKVNRGMGCDRTKGFGKCHGSSTMKNAIRLYSALIYRHRGRNRLARYCRKLDSKVLNHGSLAHSIEVV